MSRDRRFFIEQLESRTLLSASMSLALPSDVIHALPAVQAGTGISIHARAGVPFTKEVAFYASPVLDAPDTYTATINWGDGVDSQGTVSYGSLGNTPGYEIMGSNVYADAGKFKITTTLSVSSSPVGVSSDAAATTTGVTTILSRAVVVPRPPISHGGVTLTESAGQSFTADIGSITLPASDTNLTATINWGDGVSSQGQLSPQGAVGNGIQYEVIGGHTYALAGTYPVNIVIDEPSTAAAVERLALIHSGIIVQAPISLAGTITGTYRLAFYNPIHGITYAVTGAGTAGDLSSITATGTITTPGLASPTDEATGRITLTNAEGSVTLELTGPVESPLGPIPDTMNFTILSGTGAYFDDSASGTITITAAAPDGSTPVSITVVIS